MVSLGDVFQAVGIPREQSKAIWEQVKANIARLDGCAGPHDFVAIDAKAKYARRYRCTKCQGGLDSLAVRYYEKGLEHGRKP